MRQYAGEDEPSNSVDFHALPLKHDVISCLAVGARWITSVPLLQVSDSVGANLYLHIEGNYAFMLFVSVNMVTEKNMNVCEILGRATLEIRNSKLEFGGSLNPLKGRGVNWLHFAIHI